MATTRTEEEKFAEIVKNFHKVVMRDTAASKKNTDIGRTCARTILELKDVWIIDWVDNIDNRVAVYDAIAYELRDTIDALNDIWTKLLGNIDPKKSKLWAKKDTIEDLMEATLILSDKKRSKPSVMVLGDIACIFEKVVGTGDDNERDMIYDGLANALLDLDTFLRRVQTILDRDVGTTKREAILNRTKWVALADALSELTDEYEGGELDEGGAFLAAVEKLAKICEKGLKATEDIDGMIVFVLGSRPVEVGGPVASQGANSPPTPGQGSSQSAGRRMKRV